MFKGEQLMHQCESELVQVEGMKKILRKTKKLY